MIKDLFLELENSNGIKQRKKIRDKIIIECIPFAKKVARNYCENNYFDYEDIESFAIEGLINAIDHYNVEYNFNHFYKFVYKCIINSISNGVMPKYELSYKITKYFKIVQSESQLFYGRKYIPGDIEMLKDILNRLKNNYGIQDIELKKIYNVEMIKSTYFNSYIDSKDVYIQDNSLDNKYIYELIRIKLFEKVRKLTPLRQLVIIKKYGLFCDECTYKDIEKELGISFHSIKQALYNGLKDLREEDYSEINELLSCIGYSVDTGYNEDNNYYNNSGVLENVKVYK